MQWVNSIFNAVVGIKYFKWFSDVARQCDSDRRVKCCGDVGDVGNSSYNLCTEELPRWAEHSCLMIDLNRSRTESKKRNHCQGCITTNFAVTVFIYIYAKYFFCWFPIMEDSLEIKIMLWRGKVLFFNACKDYYYFIIIFNCLQRFTCNLVWLKDKDSNLCPWCWYWGSGGMMGGEMRGGTLVDTEHRSHRSRAVFSYLPSHTHLSYYNSPSTIILQHSEHWRLEQEWVLKSTDHRGWPPSFKTLQQNSPR